jgi:hypothetical protein
MPDAVAHVDAAIAHLNEIDRKVIRATYLQWAPAEALARSLKIQKNKFDSALRRARWRIWAFLKAIEHLNANSIPHTLAACNQTAPPSAGLFFGRDLPNGENHAKGVSMEPAISVGNGKPMTERRSVVWPRDLERRYNISDSTRARWEKIGLIPRRDVYLGGKPEAWYLATVEAAERGPAMAIG